VRAFIGPTDWSNYTFEADVRGTTRRRQMTDIGITAQRYSLVLYGNSQQLKLEPWEPETERSRVVPFQWKADTWYHLKLRVENTADGKVRARGKAGRPASRSRRRGRSISSTRSGNRNGAPGFFVDAEFGAYLDNLKLRPTNETLILALSFLLASPAWRAPLGASDPGSGDWPMWGGTPIATWSRT
jgi:hypothetical protein